MLTLNIQPSESRTKTQSQNDMEDGKQTVYLPMAGDQRSAYKAKKAKSAPSFTPGFMKDLEKFMEAGISDYDSEDTEDTKKERLI